MKAPAEVSGGKGQGKEDIGITSYFSSKHMKHDMFFITFCTALVILQSLILCMISFNLFMFHDYVMWSPT